MLVPCSIAVIITLFIAYYYIMRTNYLIGKPEGFIVRRSDTSWSQARTLSLELPVPNNTILNDEDDEDTPIPTPTQTSRQTHKRAERVVKVEKSEKIVKVEKSEEPVFRREEVPQQHQRSRSTVAYEEPDSTIIPVLLRSR